MESIIQIKNLTVEYKTPDGAICALRDLNLSIERGEIFGLVGESGSGKSTAAWVIMRYLPDNGKVSQGEVIFKKQNLLALGSAELQMIRGKQIAMVYQDPMTSLNPAIKVGYQIQEVIALHQGGKRKETWSQAVEILEKVHIADPKDSAHKYPHELSGGQKQRVVIAMALSCNPDLLILDEPTTGLDVTTEATILDLIEELRSNFQSSILLISHNLGVIAKVSDRMGVIYAGSMVEEGPVMEIFTRPLHPYTEGLLRCIPKIKKKSCKIRLEPIQGRFPNLLFLPQGCIFHPRCPYRINTCQHSVPQLFPAGRHRKSACFRWQHLATVDVNKIAIECKPGAEESALPARTKTLIEVHEIKKYFGSSSKFGRMVGIKPVYIHAVDGLNIQIQPSQVFGLVGESGCGKSTLGRMILKFHRPTEGIIRYEGQDIWQLNRQADKDFHREVQMIFQNPESSLNPKKTVGQIIARPLKLYHGASGDRLDDSIRELLHMVKLDESYSSRYPLQISGGEKQRVGIARAFAAQPRFVVCDEPVSAVDVSVQASILNLILDLQRKSRVALLFISHDLSVVQHISHRVGIMYLGRLVEVGNVDQVFSPPYHPYTEALLSAVPSVDFGESRSQIRLVGPVPSARRPPQGCRFHTRCPRRMGSICNEKPPDVYEPSPGHQIYCHFFG